MGADEGTLPHALHACANSQVPEALRQAVGCRLLTLSLMSVGKTFGSRDMLRSDPLLAMPQLRELRLVHLGWNGEDVEAMLHLRQASSSAHPNEPLHSCSSGLQRMLQASA